eukprot:9489892-Heterocapsa_arctica.AAC.1
MTSGVKLPPAVVNIIQVVKKLSNARLGVQLRDGAHKLCLPHPPTPHHEGYTSTDPQDSPASPPVARSLSRLESLSSVFGVSPPAVDPMTLVESSPER